MQAYYKVAIAVVLAIIFGVLSWVALFPQSFIPHQALSEVSTPYFLYKYARSEIPNRCYVDIEPIENKTLLYVRFTITDNTGTLYTNYAGTQNLDNPIQWYSPSFTPNITALINTSNPGYGEVGWINCSVSARDNTGAVTTKSIYQPVGKSLFSSCGTTDTCNLTAGKDNVSGYYFYDYIELPASQTLNLTGSTGTNISYLYLNASKIALYGNVGQKTTTEGGYFSLEGYEITTANITLSGSAGTTAAAGTNGYDGGTITFRNFDYLLTTGLITLNGGNGGHSTTAPNNGGVGGGIKSVVFNGDKPGIIEWNATLNMIGGTGGQGANGTTTCGNGSVGGSGLSNALDFQRLNDRFNHYAGTITILGGTGGKGGLKSTAGNVGCNAGVGGNVKVSLPFMVDNAALINVTAGVGGTGGNGTTAGGIGGNGGMLNYTGAVKASDNSTGFTYFSTTAVIEFGGGNGGTGGLGTTQGNGGNGTCFMSFTNCSQGNVNSIVVFKGSVSFSGAGLLRFVNGTGGAGGTAGTAPSGGEGWQYYYNSTYNLTGLNLTPTATVKSSSEGPNSAVSTITVAASGGMIRYANLSLNSSVDANSTGVSFTVNSNQTGYGYSRYTSNQTIDMHRWTAGNYTVVGLSWNNYSITNRSYAYFNVSLIPTAISCSSVPSSLINLSIRKFQITCRINNTVDSTPVYLMGVDATVGSDTINLTRYSTGYYTGTNLKYYASSLTQNWTVTAQKTDYSNATYTGDNITFKKILIELPGTVSDVKTICVLPTQINVWPVGQTVPIGVFRIVNVGNTSQDVSLSVNQTLPTGVVQGLANLSTYDWTLMTLISTSRQKVVYSVPPFDGTQNVSNYSVYRWLSTNCTNVTLPTNATSTINYRSYLWEYLSRVNRTSITDSNQSLVITGKIISSFGNLSVWDCADFEQCGLNADAHYYRTENNTNSISLNWTSGGTVYLRYNFTGGVE